MFRPHRRARRWDAVWAAGCKQQGCIVSKERGPGTAGCRQCRPSTVPSATFPPLAGRPGGRKAEGRPHRCRDAVAAPTTYLTTGVLLRQHPRWRAPRERPPAWGVGPPMPGVASARITLGTPRKREGDPPFWWLVAEVFQQEFSAGSWAPHRGPRGAAPHVSTHHGQQVARHSSCSSGQVYLPHNTQ